MRNLNLKAPKVIWEKGTFSYSCVCNIRLRYLYI